MCALNDLMWCGRDVQEFASEKKDFLSFLPIDIIIIQFSSPET